MSLSFLPAEIRQALSHVNENFITEIRIRRGLPVILGYRGEYYYLDNFGITLRRDNAILGGDIAPIINAATGGSLYSYTEQMRYGFLTCGHGVRIGLAGEYVMQGGTVNAVANITSINVRVPHDIVGCAQSICKTLFSSSPHSVLLYSKPGLGKTTKLRDIARHLSDKLLCNVLIFDERNEISAMDKYGNGYDIGDRVDVIRAGNKLTAFENAIRTMKPDVLITDELYGDSDLKAVKYATDCGIKVIASSHVTDRNILMGMPFEYFVELKTLLGQPIVYDKNFNPCGGGGTDDVDRSVPFGEQKEADADIR